MRISDWSSDVCSSDLCRSLLLVQRDHEFANRAGRREAELHIGLQLARHQLFDQHAAETLLAIFHDRRPAAFRPAKVKTIFPVEVPVEKQDRKSTRLNSSH